jgi:hypothetical protein
MDGAHTSLSADTPVCLPRVLVSHHRTGSATIVYPLDISMPVLCTVHPLDTALFSGSYICINNILVCSLKSVPQCKIEIPLKTTPATSPSLATAAAAASACHPLPPLALLQQSAREKPFFRDELPLLSPLPRQHPRFEPRALLQLRQPRAAPLATLLSTTALLARRWRLARRPCH